MASIATAGLAEDAAGAAARSARPARVTVAGVLVWALIAAGVLVMAVPLAMAAYISLFRDAVVVFPPSGYSVSWYGRILEFPRFGEALGTSLRIAAFATLGSLAVGIPASLALVRYRFVGRGLLNVLLLSPLTVPGVVIGLSIYVMVVETEIATEIPLIGSDLILVFAHLLITVPWVIRLCVANLIGLDRSVEEAAANLGARPWSVLWRITLPMMRQGIVAAALFAFIVSFENIEMTLFLVAPGQTTLPISVLQYLEYKVDPLVAAVVMVQTLVIAGLLLLLDRYVKLSRIV